MVAGAHDGETVDRRSLRILTESVLLDPAGGLEMSTLQNALALAQRGHKLLVMYGTDGQFHSRYRDAGIQLNGPVALDFNVRHPFKGLLRFIDPAKTARAWRPDIVWLNRFENIHWAQVIATWSRCPIVCHLRHMPHPAGTSVLRHNVAHYIAVSNFMREAWIEAGVNPDRISVIYNSLPEGEYPRGGLSERAIARERLGLPPDVPIVLYYGRIIEEKGVGTLLDAWADLRLDPEGALLLLVGSPSPEQDPELNQRMGRLSAGACRWFPMQSDVIPFLHAADIVVFPTWLEEGFGRVVIESLKTGRPVIASRIGAVSELLAGAMSRFLFEPRNSDELGRLITSVLRWRQFEPELEFACEDWIDARFSFDDNVTAFEQILLRYAKAPAGGQRKVGRRAARLKARYRSSDCL